MKFSAVHKTILIVFFCLTGLFCDFADGQAPCGNPCAVSLNVKENNTGMGVFSTDPSLSVFRFNQPTITFSPGRTATLASSSEPGRTAHPETINPCLIYSNGQLAIDFSLNFRSLRDIGRWTITWGIPDIVFIPTVACTIAGCSTVCDNSGYAVTTGTNSVSFVITVDNIPPAGSVTFTPAPTATAADWGRVVTLDDNGVDPDGGAPVVHHWTILSKPAGATATLSSTTIKNPTIQFDDEKDIGDWQFRADIDDDEGERKSIEGTIHVLNVPPHFELGVTPGNPMEVTQPLAVTADPITDADGGGNYTFNWVVTGPRSYTGSVNNSSISFLTDENDITTFSDGTDFRPVWHFQCTATDNEMAVLTKSVDVRVKNKPPKIDVGSYEEEISTGESIHIATSVTTDEDGGPPLTLQWDIIQAPVSAPIGLQDNFSSLPSLDMNTSANYAGTWRFRLTATDNEGESKIETFLVLVDAPPVAVVEGPTTTIGSVSGFPLTLDGSSSYDPDSRDDCPDHCHVTSDPPVQVSAGITSYTWYLIDAPADVPNLFSLGRVDEVLGINSSSPSLVIPFSKRLSRGFYTFQLSVEDGEGNKNTTDYMVDVTDDESKPIGIIIPPDALRYVDPISNVLLTDITFNGSFSFDPDNFLSLPFTQGITNYEWVITASPPGCILFPPLPSGPAATSITLFSAGTPIDPSCQGLWKIGLRVTDDDATPKMNDPVPEAIITIGNCVANLCLDYPTTVNPQIVQFSSATDVLIYFHLNSILYTDPLAVAGTIARIEIFHESDLVNPFFTSDDPNLFATDLGGKLVFHWNGYGVGNNRPIPGRYRVKITLLDQSLGITIGGDIQDNAILIGLADPSVLITSDKYVKRESIVNGTDNFNINYLITGGATADQLRWRVFDAGNLEVANGIISSPLNNGSFTWDGRNTGGIVVSPGQYKMELETFRGGSSMGITANRYDLFVYQITINKSGTPPTAIPQFSPGEILFVNSDDDNVNGISDLMESAAGENDLLRINIQVDPIIPGNVVVTVSDNTKVKMWSTALKNSEVILPKTYNVPVEIIPGDLYLEARNSGQLNLGVQIVPLDGAVLPVENAAFTFTDMKVMEDVNNNFNIDAADNQLYSVRVGLWDNAFRIAADAFGAAKTLYNEEDEARIAATGNPENFIGRDSRRYYFQVEDPSANTDPAVIDEIPIGKFNFYTLKADGTDDDKPANRSCNLIETGPNTGVFISKAMMLVSDIIDRDQPTNSGITLHPGLINYNQHNHRTRYISSPDGSLKFDYTPAIPGALPKESTLPIFNRMPEERKVMTVRIFNFADPLNLGIAAIPAATIASLSQTVRDVYAQCGIRAEIIYNHATDVINLQMGSPVNLNNVGGFSIIGGVLTPSADQLNLINLVRAVEPASAANANTIYLLYVGNFTSLDRGQSFPDGWIGGVGVATNFVMVAGRNASIEYSPAHEVGHMLTNQTLTNGEANGIVPGWAPGGHYGGSQDDFNLMRNGTISSTPRRVDNTKRWWDDLVPHLIRQITRIRMSRYLRNP